MENLKLLTLLTCCVVLYVTGSNGAPFTTALPPPTTLLTTLPTTVPPPDETPIITTLPPTPEFPHPYDEDIASCLENMRDCKWTADELAEKIIERDTKVEGSAEGTPIVDPDDVGDELEDVVAGTVSPGGTGTGSTVTNNGVPKLCLPFGEKRYNPSAYRINCAVYLSIGTMSRNAQRRAMVGCFRCRYLCEIGGEVRYI